MVLEGIIGKKRLVWPAWPWRHRTGVEHQSRGGASSRQSWPHFTHRQSGDSGHIAHPPKATRPAADSSTISGLGMP